MTKEELKKMTDDEIKTFIRNTLKFDTSSFRHCDKSLLDKEHLRFEMSGYENKTGDTTIKNQAILNKFAYLGIYDYTYYLFLDFYKGQGTLYMKYWDANGFIDASGDDENIEIDFGGYGTVDIIYEIFKLTIFTNYHTRRREN
jgi:hypothetical protein